MSDDPPLFNYPIIVLQDGINPNSEFELVLLPNVASHTIVIRLLPFAERIAGIFDPGYCYFNKPETSILNLAEFTTRHDCIELSNATQDRAET